MLHSSSQLSNEKCDLVNIFNFSRLCSCRKQNLIYCTNKYKNISCLNTIRKSFEGKMSKKQKRKGNFREWRENPLKDEISLFVDSQLLFLFQKWKKKCVAVSQFTQKLVKEKSQLSYKHLSTVFYFIETFHFLRKTQLIGLQQVFSDQKNNEGTVWMDHYMIYSPPFWRSKESTIILRNTTKKFIVCIRPLVHNVRKNCVRSFQPVFSCSAGKS